MEGSIRGRQGFLWEVPGAGVVVDCDGVRINVSVGGDGCIRDHVMVFQYVCVKVMAQALVRGVLSVVLLVEQVRDWIMPDGPVATEFGWWNNPRTQGLAQAHVILGPADPPAELLPYRPAFGVWFGLFNLDPSRLALGGVPVASIHGWINASPIGGGNVCNCNNLRTNSLARLF